VLSLDQKAPYRKLATELKINEEKRKEVKELALASNLNVQLMEQRSQFQFQIEDLQETTTINLSDLHLSNSDED